MCGEHNNYYVHILFLRFHVHIFADILKHSVLTPVGDIFYAATEMAATITIRLAALAAPPPPSPREEAPGVTAVGTEWQLTALWLYPDAAFQTFFI